MYVTFSIKTPNYASSLFWQLIRLIVQKSFLVKKITDNKEVNKEFSFGLIPIETLHSHANASSIIFTQITFLPSFLQTKRPAYNLTSAKTWTLTELPKSIRH